MCTFFKVMILSFKKKNGNQDLNLLYKDENLLIITRIYSISVNKEKGQLNLLLKQYYNPTCGYYFIIYFTTKKDFFFKLC